MRVNPFLELRIGHGNFMNGGKDGAANSTKRIESDKPIQAMLITANGRIFVNVLFDHLFAKNSPLVKVTHGLHGLSVVADGELHDTGLAHPVTAPIDIARAMVRIIAVTCGTSPLPVEYIAMAKLTNLSLCSTKISKAPVSTQNTVRQNGPIQVSRHNPITGSILTTLGSAK